MARRSSIGCANARAGHVADPAAALAGARCLLHCADREPFGIAVVEALAAGRPAIVPNAGGPAEIVTEDCGRRYPPGDAAAAAEAVLATLEDPAAGDAMGTAGRARVPSPASENGMPGRWRRWPGATVQPGHIHPASPWSP